LSRIGNQQWRRAGFCGLTLGALFVLGGFVSAPIASALDVVRVESVGVAPVRPDSASPRDAAVRKGLLEAVRETAKELLADRVVDAFEDEVIDEADLQAEAEAEQSAELEQILGNDPLVYATRFQVVEDRGAGPRLFGSDLDVDTEYVVIVSVFVDRDRIRERLTRAGILLAPPGQAPQIHSRLVLENVGEHWVYAEIRRVLLQELKMRSVIPRELSPGRAVFELNASQTPSEFLPSLQHAVSEQMELVPLSVEADQMRLLVEAFEREAPEEESEEAGAIDTRSRNRY